MYRVWEEMARLHPRGLLAVRTGAASGTVVIDVDAGGVPAMRRMIADGLLPRTLAQRTGSGYHLVYAHPGVRIVSGPGKGGPGIDIKSDDAYIVVAPSLHPRTGRPYRWLGPIAQELAPLPRYWVQRLRQPDRRALPARVPAEAVRGTQYAIGALRRQLAELLEAKEGTRNDTLNKSAFAMGQLVGAGVLRRARRDSGAGRRWPADRAESRRGAAQRSLRTSSGNAAPVGRPPVTDGSRHLGPGRCRKAERLLALARERYQPRRGH